jgi:hypothetical protein
MSDDSSRFVVHATNDTLIKALLVHTPPVDPSTRAHLIHTPPVAPPAAEISGSDDGGSGGAAPSGAPVGETGGTAAE